MRVPLLHVLAPGAHCTAVYRRACRAANLPVACLLATVAWHWQRGANGAKPSFCQLASSATWSVGFVLSSCRVMQACSANLCGAPHSRQAQTGMQEVTVVWTCGHCSLSNVDDPIGSVAIRRGPCTSRKVRFEKGCAGYQCDHVLWQSVSRRSMGPSAVSCGKRSSNTNGPLAMVHALSANAPPPLILPSPLHVIARSCAANDPAHLVVGMRHCTLGLARALATMCKHQQRS